MKTATLPARVIDWDTWPRMRDFRRDINRLFDEWPFDHGMLHTKSREEGTNWSPDAEVIEKDDFFVVKVEVPGIAKEDIDVTLTNSVLTIQGERRSEKEHKDERVHVRERVYGRFLRRFTIPDEVDAEKIIAKMQDGVLEIQLRKTTESKIRKITVG